MSARTRYSLAIAIAALILIGLAYVYLGRGPGGPVVYGNLKQYALVTNAGSPELAVISTSTDTLEGKVALPAVPHQLLVSEPANLVVFSSLENRSIFFYDLTAQASVAEVKLPWSPTQIVMAPNGMTVAVADGDGDGLALIRVEDRAMLPALSGFDHPGNLSFDGDSSFLFVPDRESGEIRVVHVDSGQIIDPIPLQSRSGNTEGTLSAVTRTVSGLYGLTVDTGTDSMNIINLRQWQQIDTVKVGVDPSRPYASGDGRYLLLANGGDRTVSILSTEFFDVEATLPGASDVTSIVTGYLERLAYVISAAEKRAIIIDLFDMKVIGEVALPGTPGPAVVAADGLKLYVTLTDVDRLAVIDVRYGKIVSLIDNVGEAPATVTLALTNNYCH